MNSVVFKEIHAPTGVTHAVAGAFTRAAAADGAQPDVVLARSTRLELWRSKPHGDGLRLEASARERLWGVVESMAVLRSRRDGGRDALLLTFRDAKLSVLEWDDAADRFATSSLHYFEGDAVLRGGRRVFARGPKAVTDPQGRCAAVLFYEHQLAVLPAAGADAPEFADELEAGAEGGLGGGEAAAVANSYVVDLSLQGIREVRDMVFLHRYNEPTLLLLHEAGTPTWPGLYAEQHDTCALTALSLDVGGRRQPRIWGATGLPSDCHSLSAVPGGGTLVVAHNLLMFHTQGSSCALAVNGHASGGVAPPALEFNEMAEPPATTAARHAARYFNNVHPDAAPAAAKGAPRAEGIDVELDAARVAWLDARTAVIGAKSGQLLAATLPLDGGTVRRIQLSKASVGPPTSAIAPLGDGCLFLASWLGDSLVVRAVKQQPKAPLLLMGPEEAAIYGDDSEMKPEEGVKADEPAAKRRRTDDGTGGDPDGHDEDIDLEALFESEAAPGDASNAAPKYNLKVLDALPALGPIRSLVTSPPPPRLAGEELKNVDRGPQQAVAAVGSGRRGALAVLRRSLVPQLVIAPIPIRGVTGLWTVKAAGSPADAHDAFLLISTAKATRVLATHDALDELSGREDFQMGAPTVAAGNLAGPDGTSGPIIQACQREVRVIADNKCQQLLSLGALLPNAEDAEDEDMVISSAEVAGAYVLLVLSDGAAILLQYHETTGALGILVAAKEPLTLRPAIDFPAAINAACLHLDSAGWLTRLAGHFVELPVAAEESEAMEIGEPRLADDAMAAADHAAAPTAEGEGAAITAASEAPKQAATVHLAADAKHAGTNGAGADADASTPAGQMQPDGRPSSPAQRSAGTAQDAGGHSPARRSGGSGLAVFCAVVRASGQLDIYQLPVMQLVFSCAGLAEGLPVLGSAAGADAAGADAAASLASAIQPPAVAELRLEAFPEISSSTSSSRGGAGSSGSAGSSGRCDRSAENDQMGTAGAAQAEAVGAAPHLLARLEDGMLLAYRAFAPQQGARLAFGRQPVELSSHGTSPAAAGSAAGGDAGEADSQPLMTRFNAVGDVRAHAGVFVGGAAPAWLIADRGRLVAHPAPADGAVAAFTPFHNQDCPQGFIIACGAGDSGDVRICSLDPAQRLDTPWPLARQQQRATPTALGYYPEAQLHIVAVSRQAPYKKWRPLEPEGDPAAAAAYATAEAVAKHAKGSPAGEVRLLAAGTGKAIFSHELEAGELPLVARGVHLVDKTAGGKSRPLIAVGTSFSCGEDFPATGRLLLFEVKPAPQPAGDAANAVDAREAWSAQMIYVREFRGPVTALASSEGALLLAAGHRLERHELQGPRLSRNAFFDAPFLVATLNVVKNYALAGDAAHGAIFVHYTEKERQLRQIAKDFDPQDLRAAELLIDGSALGFLSADAGGTLRLARYDNSPQHARATLRGQRLLNLGNLYVGTGVSAASRLHVTALPSAPRRQGCVLATVDGGLAAVSPLGPAEAEAAAVLGRLQTAMAVGVPHAAGLNPAAFRKRFLRQPAALGGGRRRGPPLLQGAFLDGDLLFGYFQLPLRRQAALAAAAGSDRVAVLSHLGMLAANLAFF